MSQVSTPKQDFRRTVQVESSRPSPSCARADPSPQDFFLPASGSCSRAEQESLAQERRGGELAALERERRATELVTLELHQVKGELSRMRKENEELQLERTEGELASVALASQNSELRSQLDDLKQHLAELEFAVEAVGDNGKLEHEASSTGGTHGVAAEAQ